MQSIIYNPIIIEMLYNFGMYSWLKYFVVERNY